MGLHQKPHMEHMYQIQNDNNILENAIPEEDKLCVAASLIMKKICCVLLPVSL